MRRVLLVVLLVAVAVLVPSAPGGASGSADATKYGGMGVLDGGPPFVPYEAAERMTRGGFVDFGARLNQRAANGGATCRTATFPTNNFRSCTWESIDLVTGESFLPPIGRGRITQIRIKAGNSTGPMRVVVLQAFRVASNNAYICCKAVRTTGTITPGRNGVSVFNTNLSVLQSRTPNSNGLYVDEHLALSMLGGNVVIPANLDNTGTSLSGWYPRWEVGQERTGPFGTSGAMVLLRARWRPA